MASIVLVVPPNPFLNGYPSLGTCFLASALLAAGHDVAVCDLGAPFAPTPDDLGRLLDARAPHLVGVSLYTESALATYELLRPLIGGDRLWVAGGVHATTVPDEPLRYGFDVAVQGEGEAAIVELARVAEAGAGGRQGLADVAGIAWRDRDDRLHRNPRREPVEDLDALPSPDAGRALFPRTWYLPDGAGPLAASFMTSRGCPGACTFCSSLVMGRRHRVHSVARVLADLRAFSAREGAASWSFHDDAFTADRERLIALCDALVEAFPGPKQWWCESRADHLDAASAAALKRAGCTTVVIGVESGDDATLRAVGKGITVAQVERALAAAKQAGLATCANLMPGLPGETPAQLAATRALIDRLGPLVDHFTPLGIPVPYPGTGLYRRHAQARGFAAWWLDRRRVETLYRPLPPGGYGAIPPAFWPLLTRALEEAVLAADFFGYDDATRAAIRGICDARAAHNAAVAARRTQG